MFTLGRSPSAVVSAITARVKSNVRKHSRVHTLAPEPLSVWPMQQWLRSQELAEITHIRTCAHASQGVVFNHASYKRHDASVCTRRAKLREYLVISTADQSVEVLERHCHDVARPTQHVARIAATLMHLPLKWRQRTQLLATQCTVATSSMCLTGQPHARKCLFCCVYCVSARVNAHHTMRAEGWWRVVA